MKDNKTILFLTGTIFKAGAGKMLRHVAGILSSEGYNVYAVSLGREQIPETDDGVHYLTPLHIRKGGIIGQWLTIRAIRDLVKRLKPNVVVPFVNNVVFSTRVATLGLGDIIVVGAERGDPYTYSIKWKIFGKWAYAHCDWCFFQLEHARDYYGEKVSKKSFVIPNAAFFNGNSGVHKMENKTIVSAGRFRYEKGYDLLLKSFKEFSENFPDFKLVIYGEGPLLTQYEQLAQELGITDKLSFPGYTFQVAKALEKEGIFVLPSRAEGIPNVLIEAMLVGIPTISCDCNPGGPRFLTDGGKRGTLVPVDDVKALTEAIIRLVEDKELYHYYEVEGPKILELLNPDLIERKWKEAFEKILA